MTIRRKSADGKSSCCVIVFAKNPILGKVKTRIAKTVGDAKALNIYFQLLKETQQICQKSEIPIKVYYADFIDPADGWYFAVQRNAQIQSPNLGDRLYKALASELESYDKVLIIGSDCPTLNVDHLNDALEHLEDHDAVIGPATDGGFYLLGLRSIAEGLFAKIGWSTSTVCESLKANLLKEGWTFKELEELNDIDEYDDWMKHIEIRVSGTSKI